MMRKSTNSAILALDGEQRLKLFVQFARTRLVALEQMRVNPTVADPGPANPRPIAGFSRYLR